LLAELTGGHIHLQHVSTRFGVESIRQAKARGVRVTAEATPHHLVLTHEAVEGYRTVAKMNPPLRAAEDVAAVRAGLADGTLDTIATDHAPHHYDEKEAAFAEAPNGIVGLETALAIVLTKVVDEGVIDLSTMIERMSCAPARAFGLPGGTLAEGSPADVTVFDAEARWTVDPRAFRSKSRNTPFTGWELRGRPRLTLVGGRVVFES
jgi:dihydroorotase